MHFEAPARLTAEQRSQVKEAVRHCPQDVGYNMSNCGFCQVRHSRTAECTIVAFPLS